MLYKGVATCYLNLLVISSCCFDTNSEMFLMIHLYQIAQLTTNGHYIFKHLSESVAQIMSQKMFSKLPRYQNCTNRYGQLNGIASHQY